MKGKKITALITAAIMTVLSVAGCSPGNQDDTAAGTEPAAQAQTIAPAEGIDDAKALLTGAEGLNGIFNPLFAESEADKKVCELIFDTVCSVDQLGELEDAAGHFAPAEDGSTADEAGSETDAGGSTGSQNEEEKTVCYQLTLNKGLKFSDGEKLTIDDVIFTWKLMADPFYDGRYSLAEVPVVGMQEYYYDTEDVAGYKKNLSKAYSSKNISKEDFIQYLIDTKLDGWFDGNLPGNLDGKGTTWADYLQSNGYETAGIEDNADALLELLAQCEYEHYSFSYDPYTYYQQKAHDDLLAGGAEVSDIEGINRVDDYTCTVTFSARSVDAGDLRAMTVIPVLSEKYYGAGYEKGGIAELRKFNSAAYGSGAYRLYAVGENSVTLKACEESRIAAVSPYVKIKDVAEADKAQALKDGTIALASMKLENQLGQTGQLEVVPVKGSGFYYFGINTDMVSRPGVRKGIMNLIDKSLIGASEDEIRQVLEAGGSSYDTGLISNLVSLTPQTWPMTRLCSCYPDIGNQEADAAENDLYEYSTEAARSSFGSEGYWNDGEMLVKNGEQLKLNMGISEELPACIKAVAWKLKEDLEALGAQVNLKEYTEGEMEATIPTAAFDMWIGKIRDLPDYDMTDYLKYGGEKNYFHHQNGYADMLFAEIRETDDDSYRAELIKEMLGDIMDGDFCRPLCQEISEVYVTGTSMVSWEKQPVLDEYDSFAEIICGIGLR